jgi:predicted metal-binding protein
MTATLYVCMTCKAGEAPEDGAPLPGALLHAALTEAPAPEGVKVVGVKCLSACSQGASVALTEPGKWGYIYGRMTPDDAPDILAGAAAYAATNDGLVTWRERPVVFRKQSLGRIPPFNTSQYEPPETER